MDEFYRRLRPHADWTEIHYRMRGDVRRFVSLTVGEDLNPRFMFSSGQRRALHLAEVLSSIRRANRQVICTVEDSALAALLTRRLRGTPEDGCLVTMAYDLGQGVYVENMERVRAPTKVPLQEAG